MLEVFRHAAEVLDALGDVVVPASIIQHITSAFTGCQAPVAFMQGPKDGVLKVCVFRQCDLLEVGLGVLILFVRLVWRTRSEQVLGIDPAFDVHAQFFALANTLVISGPILGQLRTITGTDSPSNRATRGRLGELDKVGNDRLYLFRGEHDQAMVSFRYGPNTVARFIRGRVLGLGFPQHFIGLRICPASPDAGGKRIGVRSACIAAGRRYRKWPTTKGGPVNDACYRRTGIGQAL